MLFILFGFKWTASLEKQHTMKRGWAKIMDDFSLITAWEAHREKGTHIPLHTHDFYEVVYYLQASGNSWVGDTKHAILPYSFVIIPPNVAHEEHHFADCDLFCIGFLSKETFAQQMQQDVRGSVYQIGKALIQESTEQHLFYARMILLKLQELALEIQRLQHISASAASKNFEYVINYLSQNYHEKIVMKHLAGQMHLSYDYFQHRFKEIQGESPSQFLLHKRLDAAAKLLHLSDLNCTEIAYRCGFSTSAQFSAVFKREFGISPREFRNKKLSHD